MFVYFIKLFLVNIKFAKQVLFSANLGILKDTFVIKNWQNRGRGRKSGEEKQVSELVAELNT